MSGSRADEDGQNSSWRPPGKPEQQLRRKPLCCRKASLGGRWPWLLIFAICSSTLAESMQEGSPELETPPGSLQQTDVEGVRQGRDLVEEQAPTLGGWTPSTGSVGGGGAAARELRPLIKKASGSLAAVRWARSTTVRPRLARRRRRRGRHRARGPRDEGHREELA